MEEVEEVEEVEAVAARHLLTLDERPLVLPQRRQLRQRAHRLA